MKEILFDNGAKYIGELKDGKLEGRGTYSFSDGSVYIGDFKDGVSCGKGTYTYSDGTIYIGDFKNDDYNGEGILTYSNGERYQGGFKEGKLCGTGTYTYSDGTIYIGEFKDGEENGKGVKKYSNGDKYEGDFKVGVYCGKGTYTYADGTIYIGDFKDDEENGNGEKKYSGGDKYEGGFKEGKRCGKGIYTFSSGTIYNGEFKDGEENGKGVKKHSNGDKYEGDFKDGLRNGKGIQTFSNGDKYEGEFKEGKFCGKGIYKKANGEIYNGEFKDGRYVPKETNSINYKKNDVKQEVYFKNIQSKISKLLDNAEFDVKIAVAWFTDEYLINKLKKLAKAGVNITIIIYEDRINKKDLFEELYNLNCKIYLSKKLMHNKFCVIDNDIVINGSYNWTYSAHSNSENITVTYSNLVFTENFVEEFNKLSKECNLINSYFKLNEHEENFLIYYNENKEKYELPYFFKNIYSDNINNIFLILSESEHKKLLKSQYEGKLQKFNIYNSIERKYINQFLFVYDLEFDTNNVGVYKRDFYITERSKNIQQNTVLENDLVLEKISSNGKVVKSIDSFLKLENEFFLQKSFRGRYEDYPYYYSIYNNELNCIISDLSSDSITFFKDKILCYKNKKLGVISNNGDKIEDFKYHRFEKNCLVLREFPVKVFSIRECKFYNYFENSINSYYGHSYKDEYINIESKHKNYIKYYSKVDESKTNFIFIYNSEVERKIIDKKYLVLDHFSYLQSIYSYDKVNLLLEKENVDNIAYVENMIRKEYSSHVPKPYCYIATMVYEDINHPKVQRFRDFRDNYLTKTVLGNLFIWYYYKHSPNWVKVLEPNKRINKLIRLGLDILNYIIPKS